MGVIPRISTMPGLWQTSYLAAVHCPLFWPRDVTLVTARDTPPPRYSFSNPTASPLSAPVVGRNPAFGLTGRPWMRLCFTCVPSFPLVCCTDGCMSSGRTWPFLVLLLYLFFIMFFPGCDLLIFFLKFFDKQHFKI